MGRKDKWEDFYRVRRSIFLFFVVFFGMVVFFYTLKIVNEDQRREEFHRMVTYKVDQLIKLLNHT
jgi:hypothetical protein